MTHPRIPDLPGPPSPVGSAGLGRLVCPHCATPTLVEIPVFGWYGDRPCPAKGCC